jgi:ribosomal protein L7/L12
MDVTTVFTVTTVVPEYDAFAVTAAALTQRINDSYREDGYVVKATAVKYNPENEKELYGIPAIIRVRALTSCTLVEAKCLIDLVKENKISLNHRGITVEYVRTDGQSAIYRVIDPN